MEFFDSMDRALLERKQRARKPSRVNIVTWGERPPSTEHEWLHFRAAVDLFAARARVGLWRVRRRISSKSLTGNIEKAGMDLRVVRSVAEMLGFSNFVELADTTDRQLRERCVSDGALPELDQQQVLQLIELTEKALLVISKEYTDGSCEQHVDRLHHLVAEHEACYL